MSLIKTGTKKVIAFLALPGIVYLLFFCLRPAVYGRVDTVFMLLTQSFISTLLAWGMSFNMTAGNIDMSVGAEMVMGTIVGAMFAQKLGVPGIVLGALTVAIVVGVLKSIFMALTKTKSMVISIAYTLIIGAAGSLLCQGKSLIIQSNQTFLGRSPYNIIIFVGAGIVLYLLQKYSIFGAQCRALGGNEKLAKSAGIIDTKVLTISIMISSLYAALAAIISLSYGSGAAASVGLESMVSVFSAMIGVFIAFMLQKHINIVFGIIAGSLTMNIIGMGLLSINMPPTLKDTITGAFLLVFMSATFFMEKRKADKMRRQASLHNQDKQAAAAT